jgi:hypothetical protein
MEERRDTEGDGSLVTHDQSVIDADSSLRMTLPSIWVEILDIDSRDSLVVDVHEDCLVVTKQ